MQIFLSHSSRQKPLVREIRKALPAHLGPWIDEEKLLFGDDIAASLEHTIKVETDYVILFIDDHAVESAWVRKEIEWALEAERNSDRVILLPVALDEGAFYRLDDKSLAARKYLRLKDFQEASVRSLADAIATELFSLVCRDVHVRRGPKPQTIISKLHEAEDLLKEQAVLVQKAVFPHRKKNPISQDTLLRVLNSQGTAAISPNDFDEVLSNIVARNLVPGLSYDGSELYVVEEHARWKSTFCLDKKARIAKHAASYVENGARLFIDAGSTTQQMVEIIRRKVENRAITRLTVTTTSVSIADMLSDCCVTMGFDDDFCAMRLFVPGGEVRPATQAIIPFLKDQQAQIKKIADAIGGFDLSIVGVNGIDVEAGFTTHDNPESLNKSSAIEASQSVLILGDSSKVGIALEHTFATFADNVTLITDNDESNENMRALLSAFLSKIVLV